MSRARPLRRSRRRTAPGAAPGTLAIDPSAPQPQLHAIAYGPDGLEERDLAHPKDARKLIGKWPITWINVDGLGDEAVLRAVADAFGLHPLALADVVNTNQRPKVEHYQGHQFIVLRMAQLDERLNTEQISIFLGENFVLTFQERKGDCFGPVRERIRAGRSRIRGSGADYLTYALIDSVIDNYFPALEQMGERIEALEDEVVANPDPHIVSRIHAVKRDLLSLRRAIWPAREALGSLYREPNPLLQDETRVFLRDCYDHTVQVIDMVETYRELASGLMDIYLTSVSNRMNEIMKVLTIIATIFIPLGFIAGVYGMNFDSDVSPANMPELRWPYGYVFCLALMATVAVALLAFFWRKGWIGPSSKPD